MANFSKNSDQLFHKDHPRSLLPSLSRHFCDLGWFKANGGDFSVKQGKNIYVLPQGQNRDKIEPEDLFILKPDGTVSISPSKENLKLTSTVPMLMKAYRFKNSEAVLYSQSKNAVLASMIYSGNEFRIKDIEMIENLWNVSQNRNYTMSEEVVVPIIENNASDKAQLAEKIGEAMKKYPHASAIIIRRSGMMVWGKSLDSCKAPAECIDYLMETSIEMEKLGLNEYTHNIQPTQSSTIATPKVAAVKNETPKTVSTPATPSTPASTVKKTSTPASAATTSAKKVNTKKTPIKTGRVTKPTVKKAGNNQNKPTRNTRNNTNNRMNRSMSNGPPQGRRMNNGGGPGPMNMNGPGPMNMNNMNGPGPMNMNGPGPMNMNGPMNGPGPMMGGPMMGGPGGPMMGPNGPMGPMMGPGGPGPMGGPMMGGPGGPPGMMMGPNGPMGSSPMNGNRKKRQIRGGQKNRTRNAKATAQNVMENY